MAAWEKHEIASYIAEVCLGLKQLATEASLPDLVAALDAAREAALAETKGGKPPA